MSGEPLPDESVVGRVKRVLVDESVMEGLLANDLNIVAGVPSDAELVEASSNPSEDEFSFIFYHDDWPRVRPDDDVPVLEPGYFDVGRESDRISKTGHETGEAAMADDTDEAGEQTAEVGTADEDGDESDDEADEPNPINSYSGPYGPTVQGESNESFF